MIVPTQYEIACKLEQLAELARGSETIAEVAEQLEDELGQLQCYVQNRAGIETGRIAPEV